MKKTLCFFLALCMVATFAHGQTTTRYSGKIVSCWQGKVVPAKGFDVLLYSSQQHPEVIDQLQKLSDLGKQLQDSQSQNAADAADAAYGKLEQMVASTRAKVSHTKSGADGTFRLEAPKSGSKQWLILAIFPGVEDDLSAYGYETVTDHPSAKLLIFIGDRSCTERQ